MTDAGPLRKRCARRPASGIATIPPAANARRATLSACVGKPEVRLDAGELPPPTRQFQGHSPGRRRALPGAAARAASRSLSGASSRRASIIWFPACDRGDWLARRRLTGFDEARRGEPQFRARRMRAPTISGASASRTTQSRLSARPTAKGALVSSFSLRTAAATRAGVAQNRAFDLRVLRIKGGDPRGDRGRRPRGMRAQAATPRCQPRSGLREPRRS